MAINKKLIHFKTFNNFNSKKLSANEANTQYTLGINGEIQTGSPDILYLSIVYIKDTKQQWTHGLLYTSDDDYFETKVESQNKFQEAKDYTDTKISELQEGVVTQTIQLNYGWNWVSFYVETSLEKLQNALGNNGIEIKHMDFTTSYDEESGLWLPGNTPLTVIEPSKMYMINTNSDCIIELEGKLLEDIEITLNPGLNWIAYSLNVPMDVSMALINLEATEGDQIKDANIYTNYYESYNVWYGGLNTFEPGQGYIYTNNSSETKTFKYPTELDIKLLNYETKEDALVKLQESKDYIDTKTDELRDVVTQTLSLRAGYRECSFYVDITLEQLQQALGANATKITTSFDGNTEVTSYYDVDTNTWSEDLTTLDVNKMYQIYINTDCEIHLTGRKIPNSTIYTLNPGWNWISYPLNQELDINTALKGLDATEGDMIKFRGNTYAEYFDGEWFPEDFIFKPGQGYMYKNTSTESNALVFTTELIDTKSELTKKQDVITDLDAIRQGAAKGATALQSYTEQYKGTVTGVKINGTTKNPSSGIVDLGNVITSHQDISGKQDKLVSGTNIKTINGESLLGNGNITIPLIIYIPNESSMPETPVEGVLYLIGEEDPHEFYCTFEALEDGLTVSFSTNTIQYSTDNCKTWNELPANTATPAINTGDKISFKATELTPIEYEGIGTFAVNKNFNLKGNVMSMLFGDEGKNNYDLTGYDWAFAGLFRDCYTLQSVSNDFLPATTLALGCYSSMFQGCESLVTAPELPATTLARWCYSSMFSDCESLVAAPALPATTFVMQCYEGMFQNCSSLNYIKALFTTTPSIRYTCDWVNGVSSTGTFVKNVNATWDVTGDNGVPTGWTVQLQ